MGLDLSLATPVWNLFFTPTQRGVSGVFEVGSWGAGHEVMQTSLRSHKLR